MGAQPFGFPNIFVVCQSSTTFGIRITFLKPNHRWGEATVAI